MKIEDLKLALECINNQYDLTLNTDNGYESVRSKEKILKRHRTTHPDFAHERKIIDDVIDSYLRLQAFIDEAEKSPMQVVSMMVTKYKPFSFTKES